MNFQLFFAIEYKKLAKCEIINEISKRFGEKVERKLRCCL